MILVGGVSIISRQRLSAAVFDCKGYSEGSLAPNIFIYSIYVFL